MFQAAQQVVFFQFRANHQFGVARLGHELAEPGQQQAFVAHVLGQQAFQAVEGVVLDLVRVDGWLCVGVGVALFVRQELAEEVGEVGQHFGGAGGAEAHRVGHAVVFGDAEVCQARRQVEHVAGFQDPLVGLLEVGEDAQVGVGQQGAVAVAHLADLPATAAVALEQEHVVVVEVRADAAAGCGEADHHVIDAPAGQEAELLEQLGHIRDELVDGLHQQGPIAFGKVLVGVLGERAATQFPGAVAVFQHQARLDFLFEGQARQFVGRDGAFESGDGLADQERLLLPVVTQEIACGKAAQKLKRGIRIHI
ncbi:hypothetical protein D3C85_1066750 [compost metagenome]